MYMPSAAPWSTTLVSPVTIETPALAAASAMSATISSERVDREALFEDERGRQGEGAGAHHGQVVDGAVHGQVACRAARESAVA